MATEPTHRPDLARFFDQSERRLSSLASQWRGAKCANNVRLAQQSVEEYHAIFAQLTALGWENSLPPDAELPDQLMPVPAHTDRSAIHTDHQQ